MEDEDKLMALVGVPQGGPRTVVTFAPDGAEVRMEVPSEEIEDSEEPVEVDHRTFQSARKDVPRFDEITGEISDPYLRANPTTLMSRKITDRRSRIIDHLLANPARIDQYVVESFAYTYHGFEIAKRWALAHPDRPLEYMDDGGTLRRFDPHRTAERDLPQWKYYCAFTPPYLGEEDEAAKATEGPRVEGALTRSEREDRERRRPWYQHPNSLRSEDRICVLKTLDAVNVRPYIELMDSIEGL